MLICGIANPTGESEDYNGLHLKGSEIDDIVNERSMIGIPVKLEHKGIDIGKVVSTFKDGRGNLNCVLDVDQSELEGAIATEWIKDNTASELSLGYIVDINQTDTKDGGALKAGKKKIREVSIVRKGARDGCRIYSHLKARSDDWKEAFGI